jgi:hypothetical protein
MLALVKFNPELACGAAGRVPGLEILGGKKCLEKALSNHSRRLLGTAVDARFSAEK